MVTIGPMKFSGSSRLHMDTNFGAASSATYRCKMHNGFSAVVVGSEVSPQHQHRPPQRPSIMMRKERDLSASGSPKMTNGNGGSFANAFDVDHSRLRNVNNYSIASPSSPAQYRRLESRRMLLDESNSQSSSSDSSGKWKATTRAQAESPKRQLPFNPTMTRKTAVTPRACRKATITEVKTGHARVVQQQNQQPSAGRLSGLPKYNLNELPSGQNKCRISCKSNHSQNRLINDVDNKKEPSTKLNSHTISSLNKIVKSSMSSSNTSRDTSIESIIPKYKTIGQAVRKASSPKPGGGGKGFDYSPDDGIVLNGVSSPHKRSYNPQVSIRTNKFILNDESRKTSVIIPRIRSSINEDREKDTSLNFPVYRGIKGPTVIDRLRQEMGQIKVLRPISGYKHDQLVPDHHVHDHDCDRDFFNRDPSNESLYIDFSKKRSPTADGGELSPLRPIYKEAILEQHSNGCNYKFETKRKNDDSVVPCRNTLNRSAGNLQPSASSVFYVSCASWIPKCNNKFSLRERRLLEESKTISRKR